MEMKRSFGVFFFLFLVAMAQFMVVPTEARVCESKSHHFRGMCTNDHNCGMVCRNEGFSGGHCRGFRRRCFCTRRC